MNFSEDRSYQSEQNSLYRSTIELEKKGDANDVVLDSKFDGAANANTTNQVEQVAKVNKAEKAKEIVVRENTTESSRASYGQQPKQKGRKVNRDKHRNSSLDQKALEELTKNPDTGHPLSSIDKQNDDEIISRDIVSSIGPIKSKLTVGISIFDK